MSYGPGRAEAGPSDGGGSAIGEFLIWGLVVWLHVLAAATWAGGMIFVSLILMPALREVSGEPRAAILQGVGNGFKAAGWISILVLLLTGALNMIHLQVHWNSLVGRLLAAKLAILSVVLVLSALHDFILGPRLAERMKAAPSDPSLPRLRKTVSRLTRINLALVLIVIYLAVLVARV